MSVSSVRLAANSGTPDVAERQRFNYCLACDSELDISEVSAIGNMTAAQGFSGDPCMEGEVMEIKCKVTAC